MKTIKFSWASFWGNFFILLGKNQILKAEQDAPPPADSKFSKFPQNPENLHAAIASAHMVPPIKTEYAFESSENDIRWTEGEEVSIGLGYETRKERDEK